MKPILDKEKGLRSGNLLSDILVVENPAANYHGLLGMSDGGLNILPDLAQKKQIVENAVAVFQRLGYGEPKVGIMAAIETVKDSMPATLDARALTEMNQRGEINGCLVYGPLALDIAVSPRGGQAQGDRQRRGRPRPDHDRAQHRIRQPAGQGVHLLPEAHGGPRGHGRPHARS